MNTALDILSDESLQVQLQNDPALAGLDEYLDEMAEIERELYPDGLSPRGAGTPHALPAIWPQGLVVDIALGIDPLETILLRYGLTEQQWRSLEDNRAFRIDLARASKEIAETGLSFKRKAALQAEMYLLDMDKIMRDEDVGPSVKKDIWVNMARLGELDPKKDRDDIPGGGMAFNIQINM